MTACAQLHIADTVYCLIGNFVYAVHYEYTVHRGFDVYAQARPPAPQPPIARVLLPFRLPSSPAAMDPAPAPPPPLAVHLVTGGGSSPELALLLRSLAAARVVALDAEWKPRRRGSPAAAAPAALGDGTTLASEASPAPPKFPTVTLLQVACRVGDGEIGRAHV